MNTLELFAGSGSFSKIAKENNYNTLTIDIENKFNPDVCIDILNYEDNNKYNIIWASIPCQAFSIASCSTHFNIDKSPKSDFAKKSILLMDKTLSIIKNNLDNNGVWFIENPRGLMRKILPQKLKENNIDFIQYTIWYCQYGDDRAKPTDIWTNLKGFQPKICKNNSISCNHQRAPRGSKTGTQGRSNAFERSKIPSKLIKEFIELNKELIIKEDKNEKNNNY